MVSLAGWLCRVCSPSLQAVCPPGWLTQVCSVQDALRLRGQEAQGELRGSAARDLPGGRGPPAEWTRGECFPCLWALAVCLSVWEPLLWCLLPRPVLLGSELHWLLAAGAVLCQGSWAGTEEAQGLSQQAEGSAGRGLGAQCWITPQGSSPAPAPCPRCCWAHTACAGPF